MKEKILILSGPFGEGHKQAAQALLETCKLAKPNAEAVVVDFMEWTLPRLHGLSKTVFHQGVQKFPSLYGYLFKRTRKPSTLSSLTSRLRWYGLKRIVKLLDDVRPSVVVSTFPLAAAAMSALKTAGLTDIPTVTVITDHTDHSYWIHPGTDRYVVGSEKVRKGLGGWGVADYRVTVTGIPVRPTFFTGAANVDRSALRAKLGLRTDKPVLLLMGGGYGMMSAGMIRLTVEAAKSKAMQVVVVCGHNEKLRHKLEERLALEAPGHDVRVTGFIRNMEEYMGASDLIVTKPGGLTTAEAIAMRLPMVLYRPLPGQEEDNAEFLTGAGVAVRAEDDEELTALVFTLIASPETLQAMRLDAERLHMETSSLQALEAIVSARHIPVPRWENAVVRVGV
ncbi:MGDG synthase family glycosyltransferase [Paenibacillus flagellatus]|uniref:Galactosyldiacylglycerol synthase n=1 Tax=Paenibacillus flagellatus TaxID=2211139 RepID=A0A2V5JYT7_9BACL|nr:glycosyltransferase [Paenibacillus flagellatus]PYI51911.1 galactosyldiacylglycerol synthase [Paenibacillus flagellatus]